MDSSTALKAAKWMTPTIEERSVVDQVGVRLWASRRVRRAGMLR